MKNKLEFTQKTIILMRQAYDFSLFQSKEKLQAIDLFLCIIHFHKDIALDLLGRNIRLKPDIATAIEKAQGEERFKGLEEKEKNRLKRKLEFIKRIRENRPELESYIQSITEKKLRDYTLIDIRDILSTELLSILADDAITSPVMRWKKLFFAKKLDIYVIAYTLLSNIDDEIAEFLLENDFPNDLNLIDKMLNKNFFTGKYMKKPARSEYINETLTTKTQAIENFISENMPEQKELAKIFSKALYDFWTKGNNAKAYTILLVSKSDSQLRDFINTINQAFEFENLQYTTGAESFDLSNLSGEPQADRVVLLGDSPSYKNAREGMFYDLATKSPLGVIALEHLERCHSNTIKILKSYMSNEAVDAFHEKRIYIPKNVVILSLKIEDDTYEFLTDISSDAELQEEALLNALKQSDKEELLKSIELLNNSINKLLFLPDPQEKRFAKFIDEKISEFASDMKAKAFCNREKFLKMILQSFPKTPSLDDVEIAIKRLFSKTAGLSFDKIRINMQDFPEYLLDESRRKSRQEYLLWDFESKANRKTLTLSFTNFRYKRLRHKQEVKVSKVYFKDVVGWDKQIKKLKYSMEYMINPKKYEDCPKPPSNFLLEGPPGVGKTYLVQAVATESGECPIFEYSASNSINVKALEDIFKQAQKAAPALIIIDEIDAMAYEQRQALLRILDGTKKLEQIMVFATTNHPEDLNQALLRNGRFCPMHFELPNEKQRKAFVNNYLQKWKTNLKEEEIEFFVLMTDNMNTADIEGVLNNSLGYAKFNNKELNIEILNENIADFGETFAKRKNMGFR